MQRVYRWFATHHWLGDAVFAAPLLVFALLEARSAPGTELGVLATLPLFFRRSYPVPVLLASVAIEIAVLVVSTGPVVGSAGVLLVIYASVVYPRDRRWGYLALVAAIIGAVAGPLRWSGTTEPPIRLGAVALLVALVAVAYIAGDRRRAETEFRAAELAALTERTRLLTVERDQRAQYAAVAERTRIARELHDIVAHSLAVIVVQADGGAAAAAKDPGVAEPVLRTIADTSRQALAEMRALVGVLRAEGVGAMARPPADMPDSNGSLNGSALVAATGQALVEYLPQPGLADLSRLIEQTRQTGLDVRVDLPDPLPELPATLDLTVYRIAQEGLTNVLKHAGPVAVARVRLAVAPGTLTVEVTDDGRGAAAASDGAGNGLVGMRERAAVVHGSLVAGPVSGGGYRVRAELPWQSAPIVAAQRWFG